MKKRLFSILLSLAMVVTMMPVMAFTAFADSPANPTTWADLQGEINKATQNTVIKLMQDIEARPGEDSAITIPTGKKIVIDLNGHILDRGLVSADGTSVINEHGSVIEVSAGGELTIKDSIPITIHEGFVDADGLWHLAANGHPTDGETAKTLTGGIITGGTGKKQDTNPKRADGGCAYVNGTLCLDGGNIVGNTAHNGGGVYVNTDATFNMSGNSMIAGNTGYNGAGVNSNGTFTMSENSKLAYNKGSCGGGVLADGTFIMSGNSMIEYNEGTLWAGGVEVTNDGGFTMSGNSKIMYNKGKQMGGGVSLFKGTVTLGGEARITDNTAGAEGSEATNNVYLQNEKYITIGTGDAAPTGNFKVGVTTQTAPTDTPVQITTNGTENDVNYFTSDNSNYEVKFSTGHLVLATVNKYPVWVGDTQININNKEDVLGDGMVSYDPGTHTLTLNGASISKSHEIASPGSSDTNDAKYKPAIYSEVDFTICVNGKNALGSGYYLDEPTDPYKGYTNTHGVYAEDCDVSFTGNGTLNITELMAGIKANNVTFDNGFTGKLTVHDYGATELSQPQPPCAISATGVVSFNGGTFDLISYTSNGISATNIFINDCKEIKVKGASDNNKHAVIANTALTIADKLEVTNSSYTKDETKSLDPTDSNSSDGYVIIAPRKPTPTPTPTPSEPTIVVPVSGDEGKVEVSATVSGEKATVGDISEKDIEKVISGDKGDAVVEIDLSGLDKTISEVELPVKTVEKIAETTQASGKEEAGMSVKMSAASVTFDAKATQAMVDQAEGNTIQLVVDDIKTVSLNAVQKEAVEKLDTAIIIDAYLVSNGIKLCTESKNGFAGGKATVALQYEIKNNRTPLNYKVFYVDDNGKLTNLKAKYNEETKSFVFDIEHFSNYAVAYDENGELQASKVNLTKTTTYKNGKIKLTFKRLKLSDGKKITSYQIYRSTSKKFNKNLKKYSIKRTANTKSYTWTNSKKLKKGTKYYYKVRGRVKLSDGTYAYTQWSKVKTAKCKKSR